MFKLDQTEIYLAAKEVRSLHQVKKSLEWPLSFKADLKRKATEVIRKHNLIYAENIALVMSAIAKKCWEQIKEEKKSKTACTKELGRQLELFN